MPCNNSSGGTLFDHIGKKKSYTESEARDICIVLFDTLSYIHSKGIAHRDLKPGNILLKHEDRDSDSIKIVDFGFAKVAPNEGSLITLCGSPGYVAPEILRRMRYGTKVSFSTSFCSFKVLKHYPHSLSLKGGYVVYGCDYVLPDRRSPSFRSIQRTRAPQVVQGWQLFIRFTTLG